MTKTLILLRHGEAMPARDITEADFDRVLTQGGRASIERLGESSLRSFAQGPTQFLVSTARRTQETYELARASLKLPNASHKNCDEFYSGPVHKIRQSLFQVPDTIETVIAIGHNPTWSDIASEWTHGMFYLKPGQAIVMQADANSWSEVSAELVTWRLVATL